MGLTIKGNYSPGHSRKALPENIKLAGVLLLLNLFDTLDGQPYLNSLFMIFREAQTTDVPQILLVRNSVKENILPDASALSDDHCEESITVRGKGWVCEENGQILGFAIADLQDHMVWGMFVRPEYEEKGIGKELHRLMMDWYFSQTSEAVWTSTAQRTRATIFYNQHGWKAVGGMENGDIRFEMTAEDWKEFKASQQTE